MDKLTVRQRQVLDLIRAHLDAHAMPPTRAEIARALGFRSVNAAEEHLRALARKGYIRLVPGTSRGIRLEATAETPEETLPLVGRVAAGAPVLSEENIEGRYRFDPDLFQPRPDYLLRVRGMSMRDAGILEGDLLAVHRTREARNGQIVVVRLDNEVTVKRLEIQEERVRLLPENPEFEPIVVPSPPERLAIEGIVVGVIRNGRI